MDARRISLDVVYNNQSIKTEIEPYITDFSFSDNLSGQADQITINLGDRERKWVNSWAPKKGASLDASLIISSDWGSSKSSKRKLGHFEIDQIGNSGPPNKVSIKGTSVPQSSSLRGEKKSRAWENTNFKKVATDIAKKNGLKLHFDSDDNPEFERIEQQNETDLAFLSRICNEAGFSLKVANKSIIILDEENLEKSAIVDTIKRTDTRVKNYSGNDSMSGVYKSCKIIYSLTQVKTIKAPKDETAAQKKARLKEQSKRKNKTYQYTFTPTKPLKTDRILIINEEVKSEADAVRLAKKSLRSENKEATTFSLTLAGFANYYAGQTIAIKEFGSFDGKYIITSFSGAVGSGSEVSLELRKCLEGY